MKLRFDNTVDDDEFFVAKIRKIGKSAEANIEIEIFFKETA